MVGHSPAQVERTSPKIHRVELCISFYIAPFCFAIATAGDLRKSALPVARALRIRFFCSLNIIVGRLCVLPSALVPFRLWREIKTTAERSTVSTRTSGARGPFFPVFVWIDSTDSLFACRFSSAIVAIASRTINIFSSLFRFPVNSELFYFSAVSNGDLCCFIVPSQTWLTFKWFFLRLHRFSPQSFKGFGNVVCLFSCYPEGKVSISNAFLWNFFFSLHNNLGRLLLANPNRNNRTDAPELNRRLTCTVVWLLVLPWVGPWVLTRGQSRAEWRRSLVRQPSTLFAESIEKRRSAGHRDASFPPSRLYLTPFFVFFFFSSPADGGRTEEATTARFPPKFDYRGKPPGITYRITEISPSAIGKRWGSSEYALLQPPLHQLTEIRFNLRWRGLGPSQLLSEWWNWYDRNEKIETLNRQYSLTSVETFKETR